ncbi:MAG: Na(+)-translocating NADH-quinone reductase subunit C [Gammaproteobacteria bacterium]
MSKDSTTNILLVAIMLCLVCSVIVSTAAVKLRPLQETNKVLDQKINILKVSGLWEEGADIENLFSSIETRVINLDTGEVADEIDSKIFDQRKFSKISDLSIELESDVDVANINRRSNFAKIYLVKENGLVDRYVFPVHGYGLWSTLYGYVTLEKDMNTIYALKFYDHRETPGLGGEVDNIKWQTSWKGKKLFDVEDQLALTVVKGAVVPGNEKESYQVDGLSGATLTSNGVTNMFHFWMGEYGFEKFMNKIRDGEVL